jgi:hypothetical protein
VTGRPALHDSSPTSLHLTWHDLTAMGATWMVVRGDDAHKIMHRCRHKSFSTTMLYVRKGEAIRAGFADAPRGAVHASAGGRAAPVLGAGCKARGRT